LAHAGAFETEPAEMILMDDAEHHAALAGRRVLVVEDEPFIAMTLEDMLTDFGCIVAGSVSQVSDALAVIALGQIDAAVLDVNLGAQKIDPVADELARLGFPFVFTTGYGRTGVPASHNKRGVVQKPFRAEELARALAQELARIPG
jgi:CheY-like chemotaxis protein